MKSVKIFFDGACKNKKNEFAEIGVGVAVFVDGVYVDELSRCIGDDGLIYGGGTSNIAEWAACVTAMTIAADIRRSYPLCHIRVFSDSQIISSQFNGQFRINKPQFKELYESAWNMASKAKVTSIEWIPREMNQEADRLSKEGLYLIRVSLGNLPNEVKVSKRVHKSHEINKEEGRSK